MVNLGEQVKITKGDETIQIWSCDLEKFKSMGWGDYINEPSDNDNQDKIRKQVIKKLKFLKKTNQKIVFNKKDSLENLKAILKDVDNITAE